MAAEADDKQQTARFMRALHQAMVVNKYSQRDLAAELKVVIGTMTKYLAGDVAPMKVGLGIQARLARVLNVTLGSLHAYYETGKFLNAVTLDQVESWIRSEAGQEALPVLMASVQQASNRWLGKTPLAPIEPYTWPLEELESANVSARARERLGLTAEAMEGLVLRGEFDEDLVDSFSVACNLEFDAVLAAFQERKPVE